jgi:hypothetical protein
MPLSPAVIDTMQGIPFLFNGVEYRIIDMKVKRVVEIEDTSDTSQAVGSKRKLSVKPLKPGEVVTINYWGKNAPPQDTAYALVLTGLGLTSVNAICEDDEEGGKAGDYVTGTAVFRVTG